MEKCQWASKIAHIDDVFKLAYRDSNDELYIGAMYDITVRDVIETNLYLMSNCVYEKGQNHQM